MGVKFILFITWLVYKGMIHEPTRDSRACSVTPVTVAVALTRRFV